MEMGWSYSEGEVERDVIQEHDWGQDTIGEEKFMEAEETMGRRRQTVCGNKLDRIGQTPVVE